MALPKVEKGEVFTLCLTNGFGLIQCVKEAPETESEKIRVLPGIFHDVNEEVVRNAVSGKLVKTLSPEQKLLSPWGMISIPDIVERIERNWTPLEWI